MGSITSYLGEMAFVILLLETVNSMGFRDHFLPIPPACGIIIAHE